MTKKTRQHPAASDRRLPPVTSKAAADPYDLSMAEIPAAWVEAQDASPLANLPNEPIRRTGSVAVIPKRQQSNFIANIAALTASFVAGTTWYFTDLLEMYRGPWSAVAVGALVAIVVRLTGGPDASYRIVLAAASYLLTLLVVLILITRRELTDIYGSVSQFQDYEQNLVRTKLHDPAHVAAYAIGLVTAVVLGFAPVDRS